MDVNKKIIIGLERISEVFKTLLWEKAKVHGISPMQIQILLFVNNHSIDFCNVSYLAKEFNVTKATISDAVRVLLQKKLIKKDFSPADKRRYNLSMTGTGLKMMDDLSDYSSAIAEEIENFNNPEKNNLFQTITKLINQLNQKGIIQVQRTCFQCSYYKGNKNNQHFCKLMNKKLISTEIRLDCAEFEEKSKL